MMKRPVMLIVVVGLVSVLLTLALQAQEKAAPTKPGAATPAASPAISPTSSPAAATTGEVVYTFTDETQMREFAQMWTKRQAALTRLAVLQGYLNVEQASLGQLNEELLSKYHLDVKKNYSLDTDRKVLLEREQTDAEAAQTGQPALAGNATAGEEPKP
jgi:hypothetical protein